MTSEGLGEMFEGDSAAGRHFICDFLRTAIPYLRFPVRFQNIFYNSILFKVINNHILTLFKGIRQSTDGKCNVLKKKHFLKDFHQDFLSLSAFPVNNVREFAGKMTAW